MSPEPLLLPALVDHHRGNAAGDGTLRDIMRGLIDSPRTDAERAGERLLVFGWEVAADPGMVRWVYRVVGERTGGEHFQFTLAVPGAASELPCRLLGLQLQITLNGLEATSAEELDAYMELSAEARDAL